MSKNKDTSNGRFKPGNNAGAHTGSKGRGRKSNAVKQALNDILFGSPEDGGKSLVDAAQETIRLAVNQRQHGQPTDAAVRASIEVMNRAFGRPRQTMDVKVTNVQTITNDLDAAARDAEIDEMNRAAGEAMEENGS